MGKEEENEKIKAADPLESTKNLNLKFRGSNYSLTENLFILKSAAQNQ